MTQRSPFYLKAQAVPRSKHVPPRLNKAGRWGLYRENFNTFSETRTKGINHLEPEFYI